MRAFSEKEINDFTHHVKPLCVDPNETLDSYKAKTTEGLAHATSFFKLLRRVVPSAAMLTAGQEIAFGGVMKPNPKTGWFRAPGQQVSFGGIYGAEPQRIGTELMMLERQAEILFGAAKTQEEQCAAVAFCHARFEAIHPWNDGSGRLGRAFMQAQVDALFGPGAGDKMIRSIAASKGDYIAAVKSAQVIKPSPDLPGTVSRDLGPLTRIIGEAVGVPIEQKEIPSPFRVTGRPMQSMTDFLRPDDDVSHEIEASTTGFEFFGRKLDLANSTLEQEVGMSMSQVAN